MRFIKFISVCVLLALLACVGITSSPLDAQKPSDDDRQDQSQGISRRDLAASFVAAGRIQGERYKATLKGEHDQASGDLTLAFELHLIDLDQAPITVEYRIQREGELPVLTRTEGDAIARTEIYESSAKLDQESFRYNESFLHAVDRQEVELLKLERRYVQNLLDCVTLRETRELPGVYEGSRELSFEFRFDPEVKGSVQHSTHAFTLEHDPNAEPLTAQLCLPQTTAQVKDYFPLVIFAHDAAASIDPAWQTSTAEHLASHGFAVLSFALDAGDSQAAAADLAALAEWLQARNGLQEDLAQRLSTLNPNAISAMGVGPLADAALIAADRTLAIQHAVVIEPTSAPELHSASPTPCVVIRRAANTEAPLTRALISRSTRMHAFYAVDAAAWQPGQTSMPAKTLGLSTAALKARFGWFGFSDRDLKLREALYQESPHERLHKYRAFSSQLSCVAWLGEHPLEAELVGEWSKDMQSLQLHLKGRFPDSGEEFERSFVISYDSEQKRNVLTASGSLEERSYTAHLYGGGGGGGFGHSYSEFTDASDNTLTISQHHYKDCEYSTTIIEPFKDADGNEQKLKVIMQPRGDARVNLNTTMLSQSVALPSGDAIELQYHLPLVHEGPWTLRTLANPRKNWMVTRTPVVLFNPPAGTAGDERYDRAHELMLQCVRSGFVGVWIPSTLSQAEDLTAIVDHLQVVSRDRKSEHYLGLHAWRLTLIGCGEGAAVAAPYFQMASPTSNLVLIDPAEAATFDGGNLESACVLAGGKGARAVSAARGFSCASTAIQFDSDQAVLASDDSLRQAVEMVRTYLQQEWWEESWSTRFLRGHHKGLTIE